MAAHLCDNMHAMLCMPVPVFPPTIAPCSSPCGAQVVAFCREKGVGLVIIGPEVPLVAGLADDLEAAGVPTWGPKAKAAQLEGSKAFMKVCWYRYQKFGHFVSIFA